MVSDTNPSGTPSVAEIKGIVKQATEDKRDNKKIIIAGLALVVIIALLLCFFLMVPPIAPPPADLCHNGVQDEGEEGIDCGGSCPACPPVIDPFQVRPVSVSDAAVNLSAGHIYVLDESRHRVMVYDLEFNHLRNIGETRDGSEQEGWSYSGGGNEDGELLFPAAIDIDSRGQLYVIGRAKRIQVFSKDGELVRVLRFEDNILETLPKMEDTPHIDGAGLSIAVAPDGRIYVSDELSSVVALFSNELKLIKSIGGRGSGETQLTFPGQVSYHDGRVYVADSDNARVQVFDAELNYVGSVTEGLRQPIAVALDSSGQIYVMDAWDSKLKKFDSAYNLKEETGELGRSLGMFYNPVKIKVDSGGKIYVAEAGNARVQVLDESLEPVSALHGIFSGTLTGFAPFYVAIASDGKIVVSESLNHRITLFSSSGNYIKSVGGRGFGKNEFNNPKGLAFDSEGKLFVADAWNHRIQVFSKSLEYVASIKHPELFWPVAIAVAPDGRIYVGEDSSKKVLMFDKRGDYLGSIGSEKGITLPLGVIATADRVIITDDKEKTIEIFDPQLNTVESVGDIDERVGLHVEFNESFALDSEGNLLFCDNRNRKVISYNFSTKEFSHFGDFGGFPGYDLSVLEVAASPDGKIIAVTDLVKHRLVLFDENYRQTKEITINDFPQQG